MRFTMKYVHETKPGMFYYRRDGRYWGRLPGKPGSVEFAREYERVDASFRDPGREPTEPGTVAAMIEAYLSSADFRVNLKPKTQYSYRLDLDFIRAKIGRFKPAQIEVKHVLAMRDGVADKPGKANSMIRTGRVLFAWGLGRGRCKANPFDLKAAKVKTLKMGEHQPWPPAALERFRAEGKPHLVLAMELALWTGQRQGDLIRLRWDDVRDGQIRLKQEKTGKELWLPVAQPLAVALAQAPRTALTILTGGTGRPWKSANNLALAFGDEIERLDMKGLVFHGLRKTCAVILAEAGATTKQIAAVTGQSDQMVSHYAKLADQSGLAREAVTKMERRLVTGKNRSGNGD